MFFKTDNNKSLNLKKVSNVNIVKNRIVFNMNYSVDINNSRLISDYVYWDSNDAYGLNSKIKQLSQNKYFIENFITKPFQDGFINMNEISSVKFEDNKFRVIFNLSHPVTFTDYNGKNKITSEFVYADCRNNAEYTIKSYSAKNYISCKGYKEYVQKQLGL